MKKSLIILAAAAAFAITACDKNDDAKKVLDAEFTLAHYALQKLHILPHVIAEMSMEERAFLYASIQMRVEEEKRSMEKVKG